MKAKLLIILLTITTFLSCKNNEKESKPAVVNPSKEASSVTEASDTLSKETVSDDATENAKLLLAFYKKNERKPQLFVINTNKDTTIVCAQKTRIHINAKCFVSSKTAKEVSGKIQVSVTEYYTISDILLARLSTTTNGNLLETGGMINITASSNNEKCDLKKGQTIEIEMPRKAEKAGMQLYTGSWNNSSINWEVQKNSTDLNQTFTKVDETPKFPGGIEKFYSYISKSIFNDDEITTTIVAAFTIDRGGNVINPTILRGGNRFLNAQIRTALARAPKFIPGKLNGAAVNVYYTIPIRIVNNEMPEEIAEDYQKKSIQDYDDKNIQTAGASEINFYLFSSSTLGYINCDRLWKNSLASKIDYAVNFNTTSETSTSIVFHRVKSVMCEYSGTNKVSFNSIPTGEPITIVAIKYFDKKPYLAIKESVTSAQGESNLAFTPVTIETLKTEMKKLERFN